MNKSRAAAAADDDSEADPITLSSSVPVFTMEHIPNGLGAALSGASASANGGSASAGLDASVSSSVSSSGHAADGFASRQLFTRTGSPQIPVTPNPTPTIDSSHHLLNRRVATSGTPQTLRSSSHATSTDSPIPHSGSRPFASPLSPSSTASSSSSLTSPPPASLPRTEPIAIAGASASSSSATALPESSAPARTLPSATSQPAPAIPSPTASSSSSASSSTTTTSGTAPARPASGLTAALTQMGIATKVSAPDPEATHPYRTAIQSLKKLADQK
jgi:hypothetical protein